MFSAGGWPARRSTGSRYRFSIIIITNNTTTITIIIITGNIIGISVAIDSVAAADTYSQRSRLEDTILPRSSSRPTILFRAPLAARSAPISPLCLLWKQGEPRFAPTLFTALPALLSSKLSSLCAHRHRYSLLPAPCHPLFRLLSVISSRFWDWRTNLDRRTFAIRIVRGLYLFSVGISKVTRAVMVSRKWYRRRASILCGLSDGRTGFFMRRFNESEEIVIFQRFTRFSPIFPAQRERSILPPPTEEQNRPRPFLIG